MRKESRDFDVATRVPDTSGPVTADAFDTAALAFDSALVMDLAAADSPVDWPGTPDRPSEADIALDVLVDASLGRDLGLDSSLGTLSCPTSIEGSLDSSDAVQTGRHSRIEPTSTCQTMKESPGTGPDRTKPHLYDLYRFHNRGEATACFSFTLTYAGAQLYAAAYTKFDPADITAGYLGDVGAALDSPQTMGISVAGKSTIEVVVYAIAVGTDPAGAYALTCSTR